MLSNINLILFSLFNQTSTSLSLTVTLSVVEGCMKCNHLC